MFLINFNTQISVQRIDKIVKENLEVEDDGNFYSLKIFSPSDELGYENFGSIPFELTEEGLSPAQFILDWMGKLCPEVSYLFQRPKRTSKGFKIGGNPETW